MLSAAALLKTFDFIGQFRDRNYLSIHSEICWHTYYGPHIPEDAGRRNVFDTHPTLIFALPLHTALLTWTIQYAGWMQK